MKEKISKYSLNSVINLVKEYVIRMRANTLIPEDVKITKEDVQIIVKKAVDSLEQKDFNELLQAVDDTESGNCNCLDRIADTFEKNNNVIYFSWSDAATGFFAKWSNPNSGTHKTKTNFSYVEKKKDGSPKKKRSTSFFIHNFCPFCGRKYK